MVEHLEWLKVQADINNPRVKYNFDRGISGFPPAGREGGCKRFPLVRFERVLVVIGG